MEKNYAKNPSNSQKEKTQISNSLIKPVAGLVGIVLLIVGLVLFLVFQPEVSNRLSSDEPEIAFDSSEIYSSSIVQVVDGKDVETGLLDGDGLLLVKANCTNCHSSALILQNRFTREGWHEKIVWMQETQGLWDLGASEPKILDYLAEHYSPEAPKGRRIPLSGIEWYELKD